VFSSTSATWDSAKGDYRGWDARTVPLWDERHWDDDEVKP
jgi:hypothetical protein